MALFVASLNSGSNGNCFYIGNDRDAVLIDAGISCRETVKRMKRIGLSIDRVRAIFITHEHADHIYGLSRLSRRFSIPVYITTGTLRESRLLLQENLVQTFHTNHTVTIGSLSVTAFRKHHDAIDPHSFTISDGDVNVGVFTDIGFVCGELVHHFRQCHAAFLEANYDEQMLEQSTYPYFLKNRIRGGNGHLSNKQALKLFKEHKPPGMSHLFLSHLSHNNNQPALVAQMFTAAARDTNIIVATRYEETSVYVIESGTLHADRAPQMRPRTQPLVRTQQLSIF
jgi:phosphoribosyl 1,2-cyclic phosphodiesterase